MAFLYADENFPHPVVDKLVTLGHDVMTVQAAGRAGQSIPDPEVLADAIRMGRAVLTLNRRDYIRLHKASSQHEGIIVCTHNADIDGFAQRIDQAISQLPDLRGRLIRVTKK
jgi:hypothetical protein